MPEIKIIEKEPWFDTRPFIGPRWIYPTYMVKNGVEYFMFNRTSSESSTDKDQRESRTKQLLDNGGMFFRFYGYKDNPLAYLWEVVKGKCTFTPYYDIPGIDKDNEQGYVDFGGNLNEVSAAFDYRIYDNELATLVETVFNLICEKKYDEARDKLLNMPSHLVKLSGIDFTDSKDG